MSNGAFHGKVKTGPSLEKVLFPILAIVSLMYSAWRGLYLDYKGDSGEKDNKDQLFRSKE